MFMWTCRWNWAGDHIKQFNYHMLSDTCSYIVHTKYRSASGLLSSPKNCKEFGSPAVSSPRPRLPSQGVVHRCSLAFPYKSVSGPHPLSADWPHCYRSCQLSSGKVFSPLPVQPSVRVTVRRRGIAAGGWLPCLCSLGWKAPSSRRTEPHPCSSQHFVVFLPLGKWSSVRMKWSIPWQPRASESRNRYDWSWHFIWQF